MPFAELFVLWAITATALVITLPLASLLLAVLGIPIAFESLAKEAVVVLVVSGVQAGVILLVGPVLLFGPLLTGIVVYAGYWMSHTETFDNVQAAIIAVVNIAVHIAFSLFLAVI